MSDDTYFPERSEAALAVLDLFYVNFNEFNFYVEDIDQENLYFQILKKVFNGVSFSKIFPLGGKCNVLEHAKNPVNNNLKRRVYILDKDFDDFLGVDEKIDGVFYLDRFCIENYLLEQESIVEVVLENHPKLKFDELLSDLDLITTISQIEEDLLGLFSLFFLAQKYDLGVRNCSEKPEKFCCSDKLWVVSKELYNFYLKEIDVAYQNKEGKKLEIEREKNENVDLIFSSDPKKVLSGKFVLSMVFHYIKKKYKMGSITFDSFVYRIAKNEDFGSLEGLAENVKKLHGM